MNQSRFTWMKELMIPMFLIIFTGIVTGIVGLVVSYYWETFKFKQQTLFETRVDLIADSRKQAAELFIEFDRLRRQIKSNEVDLSTQHKNENRACLAENLQSETEELKSAGLRLKYLGIFSKNIMGKGKEINDSANAFYNKQLKEYVLCLEGNNTCEICTEKHPDFMTPLNEIIQYHNEEIVSEVRVKE